MEQTNLAGRTVDIDLGPFVPRLSFLSDSEARLHAEIGPTVIDEVVAVDVAPIGPDVFVVSWTEQSGNFIVQVQNYQSGVVHNRARLADGQLFSATGTLRRVNQDSPRSA
jgi:hypothetical protein